MDHNANHLVAESFNGRSIGGVGSQDLQISPGSSVCVLEGVPEWEHQNPVPLYKSLLGILLLDSREAARGQLENSESG